MYESLCSVLPPENWSPYLPNKGNSLLYLLLLIDDDFYLHLSEGPIYETNKVLAQLMISTRVAGFSYELYVISEEQMVADKFIS